MTECAAASGCDDEGGEGVGPKRAAPRLIGLTLLLLPAIAVPDALATFPGRNGQIAFVSAAPPASEDGGLRYERLWMVRPGSRKRLVSDSEPRCPAFSPDGRKLAVSLGGRIRMIRGRAPARRLGLGICPKWSPDGRWLAFQLEGALGIGVMRADGTGRRRLAGSTYVFETAAWSPGGGALAYSDGTDVYVVNADGTGLRKIARGDSVAWSARGDISYLRGRASGRANLYAIRPGGSERLLASGVTHPSYSWAPRGGRVMFFRPDGRYVVPASGGRATRVLGGTEWASWSPDGRRLLFQRPNDDRLMVAPVRGGRRRVVARLPRWCDESECGFTAAVEADWQPLAPAGAATSP